MSASPETDSLSSALEPLSLLHAEFDHVASWVDESFAVVDAVHAELAEWQLELAEQQAALEEKTKEANDEEAQASRLQRELEALREEIALWESDGMEQADALEKFEQRESALTLELDAARQTAASLLVELEAERLRANIERDAWMTELRELRRVLMAKWDVDRAPSRERLVNSDAVPTATAPSNGSSGSDQANGAPEYGDPSSSSGNTPSEGGVNPASLAAALRMRADQRRQSREQRQSEP